jgi:hypothetical protein
MPIDKNGTSIFGDLGAGERGCSIGKYPVGLLGIHNSENKPTL